jgi:hypothetical protein
MTSAGRSWTIQCVARERERRAGRHERLEAVEQARPAGRRRSSAQIDERRRVRGHGARANSILMHRVVR